MLFFIVSVYAQQAEQQTGEPVRNPDGSYSTSKYNEAERPDDSYLAKFYAQDVVEKLMKKNLDQILLLKVVSTNFPDKGWGGDFDKCYEGYKKAVSYYYQRNMVYARQEFETNKKNITELLKKAVEEYEKDSKVILDECIAQILVLHFNEKVKADPAKSRDLVDNQIRLRIGFGQLDDGAYSNITMNYEAAIYHFRMAKTYGIKILEEISKPEERDGIKSKYQVQKADNLNRIFDKSKSGTN
ncbi:MAG: hypothetical protein LBT84_02650 [Spirochaetia bacterium]|nr:hypothetical protein [Spirochaetia bacterium]